MSGAAMNPAAALLAGMRPPMLNPLLAAGLRPGGLPGIPSMPGSDCHSNDSCGKNTEKRWKETQRWEELIYNIQNFAIQYGDVPSAKDLSDSFLLLDLIQRNLLGMPTMPNMGMPNMGMPGAGRGMGMPGMPTMPRPMWAPSRWIPSKE